MPCTVTRSADGKLRYRLRWKGLPGYESKESTGIPADREHREERRKMERNAKLMSAEMAAGKFDYLAWFPNGSKADYLRKQTDGTTLRQYAEATWLPRMVPPAVRAWCSYDYRKHMNKHILSALGDFRLADVTTAKIVTFRADLLAKGLSMKSCRNVIDATLRACLRDARTVDKLMPHDPFADLPPKWWGRRPALVVDPFTDEERDALLDHFRQKRPHYYPFICAAFWTGARPSELVGLRWGDVDLRVGKLMIRRSRTMGEDNACKTTASERTVDLVPIVVDALRQAKPLHVTDQGFVFTNTEGRSIIVDNLDRVWHPALRAKGIRPRKFYATRHTFISSALARGARVKWVATYCGTSVAMIEKHYSKWLDGDSDQLALLASGRDGSPARAADRAGGPISGVKARKTGPSRVSGRPRKLLPNH